MATPMPLWRGGFSRSGRWLRTLTDDSSAAYAVISLDLAMVATNALAAIVDVCNTATSYGGSLACDTAQEVNTPPAACA
jgi:hypothetical protein